MKYSIFASFLALTSAVKLSSKAETESLMMQYVEPHEDWVQKVCRYTESRQPELLEKLEAALHEWENYQDRPSIKMSHRAEHLKEILKKYRVIATGGNAVGFYPCEEISQDKETLNIFFQVDTLNQKFDSLYSDTFEGSNAAEYPDI